MENEFQETNLERPFEFRQCITILKSTGKKAASIIDLRQILGTVSEESIFHHTYQYFLKEHILEYTNDFAHWAGESLEERALAEELSNIDPYSCVTLPDLREALLKVMDAYIEKCTHIRYALPGEEFHFNETITYVFPIGIWARNLAEFMIAMKFIDNGCVYYHFYEARMRVPGSVDDFSAWFEQSLGKKELAEKLHAIDPFMHSTPEIRELIVKVIMDEVSRDMEKAGVNQ
ncbi:MAG: DUF5752 family protein [Syntrophorhabdaceae bacterium]